jgi:hypothetical protein
LYPSCIIKSYQCDAAGLVWLVTHVDHNFEN